MMCEIDHDKMEVVVTTKDVAIGSMEDRIIRSLANRGYTIREKTKMTTALTVVDHNPFTGKEIEDSKEIMYKKYEVIYQMRNTPDGEFESRKYIARVVADTAEDVRNKITSCYVKVDKVLPVGRQRSSYMSNRNIKFHAL